MANAPRRALPNALEVRGVGGWGVAGLLKNAHFLNQETSKSQKFLTRLHIALIPGNDSTCAIC